jgi:ribosomal protein S18 acetylase RimI-like enzyme
MQIRKAVPDDAAKAAVLIREAIKDIAEALTGEKTKERILGVLQMYFRQDVNRLSYRNCIVVTENGALSGIIVAYHGRDVDELDRPINERLRSISGNSEFTVEKESEREDYYIDTLCVNTEYRGRGNGAKLIEAAEQEAKRNGFNRMSLNVEKDNARARLLYQKLGYKYKKVITINDHSYDYMVKIL